MVAANSIAATVRNMAVVLYGGIAAGGAVLIGKYLSNNEIPLTKRAGNRINRYALLCGALAGTAILVLKPVVFALVNLTPTARDDLDGMLFICAVYGIGAALNSTNIGGIFPARGDAKVGLVCGTIVMGGMVLPFSFICAFVWRVPPVTLFAVSCLDEFIKLPAALVRYRQYRWLKNITREFTPAR
jgi:Na+-driven multidrug efflux pump